MIWLIDNVLDGGSIRYLTQQWSDDMFHCGSDSNPRSEVKKNLAMNYDHPDHDDKCNYFYDKLRPQMEDYLIKRVGQPYFLWYKQGHHYDYHLDAFPIAGIAPHYSFTCFLNDPSEYEGGELTIKMGPKEITFKEKAGTLVMYNTGLWHKVNPVISGDRKVIVGWAESLIRDSRMRELIIDMKHAINDVANDITHSQLEKLESVRINLIREYAEL